MELCMEVIQIILEGTDFMEDDNALIQDAGK